MSPKLKRFLLRSQLALLCWNCPLKLRSPGVSLNILPRIQCRGKITSPFHQIQLPKDPVLPSLRTTPAIEVPKDIGLLPFTYIKPTGKKLPSIFTNPWERWGLYQRKWKYRLRTILGLALYKWYTRSPLRLSEPKRFALDLYKKMYTSYASGDLSSLRGLCNDGLYETFRRRISLRPTKNKQTQLWTLHSLIGPNAIKVITNQAVIIDPTQKVGMRQAVVKIKSLQSLAKYDYKGDLIPGTGETKEVTEYVVLQKRHKPGEKLHDDRKRRKETGKIDTGDWCIWGTTDETTLDILKEREKNPLHIGTGAKLG